MQPMVKSADGELGGEDGHNGERQCRCVASVLFRLVAEFKNNPVERPVKRARLPIGIPCDS